jgi:TPP-dependent 2-oxoacid decarboxylase
VGSGRATSSTARTPPTGTRLNGISALVVTHGVGALSAINGVAGAYSEHVPVICIAGSLPARSLDQGLLMHYTFADGGSGEFLHAYTQVTAAQTHLTPQNAATEIDRMIITAWRRKLPARAPRARGGREHRPVPWPAGGTSQPARRRR